MARSGGKKVLPIKRVVRAEFKDKVDTETLALIAAYQEWHRRETGEETPPSPGEVVDAAVREQILGLPGFKQFLKEFESRQLGGARRGRGAGAGAAASSEVPPAAGGKSS